MIEICPICQCPKSNSANASITQWIASCSCETSNDTTLDKPETQYCNRCNKKVEIRRDGSFTQFIFTSYICKCETPDLGPPSPNQEFKKEAEHCKPNYKELHLNKQSFPMDRFKPVKILGIGSVATVYLAIDRLLNTSVAIKVIDKSDASMLIGFQSEAKAISKLHHTHIVRVLDFGITSGNIPYMVLEYIDGLSLAEVIADRNAIDWQDCTIIFTQLANALSYAHKKKIIHRDLNLSNIIIESNKNVPHAKIVDFGLTNQALKSADSTSNTIVGTPLYMPPELVVGTDYDQISEIYSLGCVMYEAILGSPPYCGDTAALTISMHRTHETPHLANASSVNLPIELADVIYKAMHKNRDLRYQSMTDFEKALLELQESEPTTGIAESGSSSIQEYNTWLDKYRIIVFVTALFGVGLFLFTICNSNISQSNDESIAQERNSINKNKDTPSIAFALLDKATTESNTETKYEYINDTLICRGAKDSDFKSVKIPLSTKNLVIDGSSLSFTGAGLAYINLEQFLTFKSDSPALNDSSTFAISKMKNLNYLNIAHSNCITDLGYLHLSRLKKVRVLKLRYLKLSPNICKYLSKIENLTSIDFGHCKNLDLKDLSNLVQLKKLGTLKLAGTAIGDPWIKTICKLRLKHLEIHQTKVTDIGLQGLKQCSFLKVLKIETGKGITEIGVNQFRKNNSCHVVKINGQ